MPLSDTALSWETWEIFQKILPDDYADPEHEPDLPAYLFRSIS